MKQATGAIRCVDKLGRVVVPMYMRRICDLKPGTEVEILLQGEEIIIQRRIPLKTCTFCNAKTDLTDFHGKWICNTCRQLIKKL